HQHDINSTTIHNKPHSKDEDNHVIANTPIITTYVVLGVDPNTLEIIVEIPFPTMDRSSPGSFTISLPTILPVTIKCPICSGTSTSAAGKIISMSEKLNLIE